MSRTDRILVFQRQEARPEEETPPPVPEQPPPSPPQVSDEAMEELVLLYGGEIVHDALTR